MKDQEISIELIKINLIIVGGAITAVTRDIDIHSYLFYSGFALFIIVIGGCHLTLFENPENAGNGAIPIGIYINFTAIGSMGLSFLPQRNSLTDGNILMSIADFATPLLIAVCIIGVHLQTIRISEGELTSLNINDASIAMGSITFMCSLTAIYTSFVI